MESARSKKTRAKKRIAKKGKKTEDHNAMEDGNGSDSASTIASSVDTTFSDETERADGQDVDEVGDNIEQLLLDNIEGATAKSAKERQASLKELRRGLTKRVLPEFVDSRRDTLLDIVERLLKRGQSADKEMVAKLGSLLCMQLGATNSTNIYQTIKPILISTLNDHAQSVSTRASCASALGMCCFIASEELGDVVNCMSALLNVIPADIDEHPAHQGIAKSAVLAWGLLLTVASSATQQDAIESNLQGLCRLLEKGDLNLRLATGEVIALIYELGREIDDTFDGYVDGLYDLLKELATDSSRYKAKREKRQQRSTFRDILRTVESSIVPSDTVKFGMEKVELDSWTRIRQYNALKECLGSGITTHLQENLLLRQIFDLGPPIVKKEIVTKEERWGKTLQNAAANKERTKLRSKGRENKRAAHGF